MVCGSPRGKGRQDIGAAGGDCQAISIDSRLDGPLDSIRWEVFAESLQDYAMLQSAGIRRDDPMLAALKTYADFPKNEAWLRAAIEKIIDAPAASTGE